MHNCYDDILSRIDQKPLWFDEVAVPRFDPFHPNLTAYIYADAVLLLEIACQGCGHRFDVAMSDSDAERLRDRVRRLLVQWGDPPNTNCCLPGPTMSSEPQRIVEFWARDTSDSFEREPDLEFEIDAEAASQAWLDEVSRRLDDHEASRSTDGS